ncbi:DsbA family protein [Ornithinimicrobium panacihumi]|uniref:DsbA family protein n=1 Tax=Ornithinimicrobium panacihumi TaxID=2008449 RepID=UPI003F8BAFCA
MTATPPANDSKASSIAWAIATIVVALVAGLIAYLAMSQRGDGTAAAPPATAPATAPAAPTPDPAQAPAAPEAAPQTPSPEVQQMLMDLQRRDPEDPMAVGEVDAPVVMIEYADYRCPYCTRFHLETRPELMPLVEDGTLRIEFRDLVLFGEGSQDAAIAARAAAQQDKLVDYQSAVFERSSEGRAELTRDDLVAIAEEVGVPDLDAFTEALDDEELAAAVEADTTEARSLGISSTPTFLINTAVVQGAYEAAHFRTVIEQQKELAATP